MNGDVWNNVRLVRGSITWLICLLIRREVDELRDREILDKVFDVERTDR